VYKHADIRDKSYDNSDVKTTRALNQEKGQTHIRGLKGEIAFADFYGLQPDLQIRPEGDDGIDFEVEWCIADCADVTVDLKTTRYDTGNLLVKRDRRSRSDRYVLAVVPKKSISVRLIGWVERDTVLDAPLTDHTGHFVNHEVRQNDLRALPDPQQISPQQ
jgi:hypothetical protein